ncbi:MAG: hypothetical protein FWG50_14120 [Kiritimatiellaeota bacterium]|nr:hypothetical protein [Kiritimatiellota bacterium]
MKREKAFRTTAPHIHSGNANPVCNVDLAKYGLAMPEIDLPPNVKDEIRRRSSGSAGLPPCR